MNMESLGGVNLFRPSHATELAVRQEAEAAIRQNRATGEYKERDEINAILQEYFSFYDAMLKKLVPQVASRHFMEFILAQYDFATEIEWKHKNQQLNEADTKQWKKLGPVFRRAAKYLAECVCMLAPDEAPQAGQDALPELTDRCWICAEQMVELSILSTQTFVLFPDNTTLEIRPEGESVWFVLSLDDPATYEEFGERVRRDTGTRKDYINEAEVVYDKQRLADHLDERFEAGCGFSITKALEFSFSLNVNALQPGDGFDIPFIREQQILSALTETGLPTEVARRLLDGLCLRREKLLEEGRVVWKPKQEYRAYTRPFFEFPHPTGTHVIWSRRMAEECLMMLYTRFAQKQVPPEWRLGGVSEALEDYAASITKSFEEIVNDSLGTVDILARRFKSSIGHGANALVIPDYIGELDTLGYWPAQQLLIVGEDKFVKPTHEPATFRDDVDKFIEKDKNYVDQLKRKTEWVVSNADAVANALALVEGFPSPVSVTHIAPVLVTYYPAFASCLIADVPCASLSELMSAIKQAGTWPYQPVHSK